MTVQGYNSKKLLLATFSERHFVYTIQMDVYEADSVFSDAALSFEPALLACHISGLRIK